MTAAHNVLFTPLPSSSSASAVGGHGHVSNRSSGSMTDVTTQSGRPFDGSVFSSRLLGDNRRTPVPDTSTQRQPLNSSTLFQRKWSHKFPNRTTQTWRYATLGLTITFICWVVYCTIRYFVAVRVYSGDHIRSRYALGMGITSAFTVIFFAGQIVMTLRFFNSHLDRRLSIMVHSLAFLSSTLVLCLTVINLVLIFVWRTPHNPAQFGRSIQGRCHLDLDVVWSGTGMVCIHNPKPFSGWLGAAIGRLTISAVLIVAYLHNMQWDPSTRETHQASRAVGDVDVEKGDILDHQPNVPITAPREASPQTSNLYDDDSLSLPRSDSPMSSDESLGVPSRSGSAQSSRRATYLRTITPPSNDLDEFASAFQNLVLNITQETQEGMMLDNITRPPRPTVRVLGSEISRMSTIDSLGSREAGSVVRSPTSDTPVSVVSKHFGSRERDREESVAAPSTPDVGSESVEEPSPKTSVTDHVSMHCFQ